MNYDDFPILNNSEYQILNEQYNKLIRPERKDIIIKICTEISQISFSFFQLKNKYNCKILNSLNLANKTFEKIHDNLASCFNVTLLKINQIENFNLFTFLKRTTNLLFLLNKWITIEEKEYYKSLAEKSYLNVNEMLNEIFNSLQQSNVTFFKHM